MQRITCNSNCKSNCNSNCKSNCNSNCKSNCLKYSRLPACGLVVVTFVRFAVHFVVSDSCSEQVTAREPSLQITNYKSQTITSLQNF